jgi:hypothetical protein
MSYTVPKSALIDYPPEAMKGFTVYGFAWIDNLHFLQPPERFIEEPEQYVAGARNRFLEAGWAGDGEIGLLWLPPFVFPQEMAVPTTGILLWHVKQVEDGESWLLSPIRLPFERLPNGDRSPQDLLRKLFE